MQKHSIIRFVHNRQNPYIMVKTSSIWDENLSLEAVGLLVRILSRPDNWKTNLIELGEVCKLGRDKIRRIVKELIDRRYIVRTAVQNIESKKFNGWDYFIFESPATEEEFKKCFRQTGFTSYGSPVIDNKEYEEEENASLPTEKERLELERRRKDRRPRDGVIKNQKRWEETVLQDIRREEKQKTLAESQANAKQSEEQENVRLAKQVEESFQANSSVWVGTITCDDKGLLTCTTDKGISIISPYQSEKTWKKRVDRWKK